MAAATISEIGDAAADLDHDEDLRMLACSQVTGDALARFRAVLGLATPARSAEGVEKPTRRRHLANSRGTRSQTPQRMFAHCRMPPRVSSLRPSHVSASSLSAGSAQALRMITPALRGVSAAVDDLHTHQYAISVAKRGAARSAGEGRKVKRSTSEKRLCAYRSAGERRLNSVAGASVEPGTTRVEPQAASPSGAWKTARTCGYLLR